MMIASKSSPLALTISANSPGSAASPSSGPWMLAGAWIGVLAGEPVAHAYLALIGLA